MMHYKIRLFPIIMLLFTLLSSCSNKTTPETEAAGGTPWNPSTNAPGGLRLFFEADKISVWAAYDENQTAQDTAQAILEHRDRICTSLQTPCQFSARVEIYPNQESFDLHVMNPEMAGFFAVSGFPDTIQMVSPAEPAPHTLAYDEGILIAVHEFAHLALDEVNPSLPLWLDEGTAVFLGPHEVYDTVCKTAFPFQMIPSLIDLQYAYHQVQAPDLFAYAAIDFIVQAYGIDKLNQLLREPGRLAEVLGVPPALFEEGWRHFMETQYNNNRQTTSYTFSLFL